MLVIDDPRSEVKAFADDLQRLSLETDLDVDALSAATGLLGATIGELTTGTELFSWEITCIYLNACGVDTKAWWPRWRDLARRLSHRVGSESELTGPLPDPALAVSPENFTEMMEALKRAVGNPSYLTLEKRAAEQGDQLPHATIHEAIRSRKLLRCDRVEAFVKACGLPKLEVSRWRSARLRVGEPAPEPVPPLEEGRWRAARRLIGSRVNRRGVRRVLLAGVIAVLLLLVLHTIKVEQASPTYLSLAPVGAVGPSSVDVSFTLPEVRDWDLAVRLSLHNSDSYSDCWSRSTVSFTVRANGRIVSRGEMPPRELGSLGPVRLGNVDSVRIEAVAKSPPPVLTSVPDGCSKLELRVEQIEVKPVVSGWLSWVP